MKLFDLKLSKRVVGIAALFLSVGAFAQDDCGSAVTVTDLTGTNCTTSAPSTTNAIGPSTCEEGSIDTWFQFTAQGSTADITVSNNLNGWRPEIVIVQSTPASSCAGAFSTFSCNDANGNYNSLAVTGLTPLTVGETYWIVVTSNNNNTGGTLTVCVDNPPAGPCSDNELCGSPLTLTLNAPGGGAACVTDCNTGASAGPDFAGTNCYDLPNETVWYSITTDATTVSLDITLNSTDLSDPEYTLFSTPDCFNYTIIDCQEGTGGSASGTGITVNPSTTYLIAVSDVTGDEGDFDLCVTQTAAPTGSCVDNQECVDAAPIALNGAGNAASCVTDCNTAATPGLDFTGPAACSEMPNPTVWYTFTTSAGTASLDIDLTSSDLSDPEFAVFTNANCIGPWVTVECNEGSGGSANSTTVGVAANTTYVIAISDASGDVGNFDLCITENPDNSACNTDNTLAVTATSMGSPFGGPFMPGEIVSFCYTINTFTTGIPSSPQGCNYLQGIVPQFGDCWDPVSFDAQGMPVTNTPPATLGVLDYPNPAPSCEGDPAGTWSWFPSGSVQYNLANPNAMGYTTGDDVGAGWFFTTSYSSITGACNGGGNDPNSSYGDNDFVQCNDLSGWTVCFDLQVKDAAACGVGETDCAVSVKTLADGEIGVWNNIGCTADLPTSSPNTMNCALPIELGALSANYVDRSVLIDWTTLTEENTDYFILEHITANGEQVQVGTVKAAGDSQEERDYRFVHDAPHPGVNYYNLKGVDLDGTVRSHGYVTVNATFNYAYYDQDTKEIVLSFDTGIEVYSMDGTMMTSSKTGTRIPFDAKGVFMIRDLNSGFMQRLVTH